MATYSIGDSEYGAYEKALGANTPDTINVDRVPTWIEIKHLTADSAPIYFTLTGATPTVKGAQCLDVLSGSSIQIQHPEANDATQTLAIKLICSSAVTYSVSVI